MESLEGGKGGGKDNWGGTRWVSRIQRASSGVEGLVDERESVVE